MAAFHLWLIGGRANTLYAVNMVKRTIQWKTPCKLLMTSKSDECEISKLKLLSSSAKDDSSTNYENYQEEKEEDVFRYA